MVFFNPKIEMKYSTAQAIFCICLLMIMQMTTNVIRGKSRTQLYIKGSGSNSDRKIRLTVKEKL